MAINNVNNIVLKVHHIDVGQGDSSLIIVKEGEKKNTFSQIHQSVLIDAGLSLAFGQKVFYYVDQCLLHSPGRTTAAAGSKQLERKPLDAIINSHPDNDHIAGLPFVIYSFLCDKNTKIYDQGKLAKQCPKYEKIIKTKRYLLQYEILSQNAGFYTPEYMQALVGKDKDKNQIVEKQNLDDFKVCLKSYNDKGIDLNPDDNTQIVDYYEWLKKQIGIGKDGLGSANDPSAGIPNVLFLSQPGTAKPPALDKDKITKICTVLKKCVNIVWEKQGNETEIKVGLKTNFKSVNPNPPDATLSSIAKALAGCAEDLNKCLVRVTDPVRYKTVPPVYKSECLMGQNIFDLTNGADSVASMQCIAANGYIMPLPNKAILGPNNVSDPEHSGDKCNQMSLAFLITFNGYYYYTGGDIGQEQEKAIAAWLENPKEIMLNSFKVSHHASTTSTPQDLVNTCTSQTIAFVSYGWANDKFGHPKKGVIDRLIAKEVFLVFTSLLDFIDKTIGIEKFYHNLINLGVLSNLGDNSRKQTRYTLPGTAVLKVPYNFRTVKKVEVTYDQLLKPEVTFPVPYNKALVIDERLIAQMMYTMLQVCGSNRRKKTAPTHDKKRAAEEISGPTLKNVKSKRTKTDGISLPALVDENNHLVVNAPADIDTYIDYLCKDAEFMKAIKEKIEASKVSLPEDVNELTVEFKKFLAFSFKSFCNVQSTAKRVRVKEKEYTVQGIKLSLPI